jgi:hypothetical protein
MAHITTHLRRLLDEHAERLADIPKKYPGAHPESRNILELESFVTFHKAVEDLVGIEENPDIQTGDVSGEPIRAGDVEHPDLPGGEVLIERPKGRMTGADRGSKPSWSEEDDG